VASEREQTLADYIVLALNPVLIMVLVGSLVFFLLEVCYAGRYGADMRWTLFFFVIAVVSIARVSMTEGISSRAGCYAPILGLLVWLAMQKYVDFDPKGPAEGLRGLINLGLIGLVWWCAHRLTWDCTYQGEEADSGGEGLLKASGLSEPARPLRIADCGLRIEESSPAGASVDPSSENPQAASRKSQAKGWVERFRCYREERKKKRTQGTWVIYFSLAALPLFGLGQSLIPVEAEDRRRYAFWLMTIYVASGLGLLLTTSFLGLRRYLRQRKLKMPPALSGVWLSMGAALIVVLLVLGTFLPRPQSEYPLIEFTPAGSPDAEASERAMRGENAGKDKGRGGGDEKEDDQKNSEGKDGRPPDQEKDQQGKDGSAKDDRAKDGAAKESGEKDKDGAGQRDKEKNGQKGSSSRSSQRSSSSPRGLTSFLGNLGPILKWIVFALVALVVLVVLLRNGLKFLANFFEWARHLLDSLGNLFAGLFGGGGERVSGETVETERKAADRPYATFHNPFHDGRAGRMSVKELLCYSFAALQSWARERGYPRQQGETPLEFAARLCDEQPALEAPVRRLTNLYVRAVYAPEVLPDTCVELVEQFWGQLESATDRPLSAV
jgi:Domain of unknown function (DUF4129)